ncbi:MAG: hypothetical protein AABZ67_00730 [Pseudomonadota bacterium]
MSSKKGLTVGKIRGALYKTGKVLGDINAVIRGTIIQRILRRIMGSWASRTMSAVLRDRRR